MLHVCLDDSPRFKWIEMQEVSSTNDFLRNYHPLTPLTLVTADYQTAGRGQVGNRWESEPGKNLLCSFLFTPPTSIAPAESFVINKAIALAVRDACQEFISDEVTVKWPNDIYVGERKLAGILIETEMTGKHISRVIAGIGINVNQTEWQFTKADTHPIPTSIKQLTGSDILVRNMTEQLVGHMQKRLPDKADDYLEHLYRRGGLHSYTDAQGEFQARIADIESTGHLVLETPDGQRRRYAFKEVAFSMFTPFTS